MPRDNIVQMWPRAVPPMKGSAIARAFGEPAHIVEQYDEFERHISEAERNHETRARRIADRECAEALQRDADDACRASLYGEISDALFWLGLGAIGGSFAVVLSAWIIGKFVL